MEGHDLRLLFQLGCLKLLQILDNLFDFFIFLPLDRLLLLNALEHLAALLDAQLDFVQSHCYFLIPNVELPSFLLHGILIILGLVKLQLDDLQLIFL